MANVFYLAGFIEAWGQGYDKIRNAFEAEGLEVPVFEEVRGGMMATIKREKFGYSLLYITHVLEVGGAVHDTGFLFGSLI